MFDRCPTPEAIAEWIAGTPAARVERHVARCAACRSIADEFRGNDAWLAALQAAVQHGCDDPSRRRIREVCRTVERESPPR